MDKVAYDIRLDFKSELSLGSSLMQVLVAPSQLRGITDEELDKVVEEVLENHRSELRDAGLSVDCKIFNRYFWSGEFESDGEEIPYQLAKAATGTKEEQIDKFVRGLDEAIAVVVKWGKEQKPVF